MPLNLESITCPNCKSPEAETWARENGFTALKCANCGLIYVSPRPRLDSISEANKIGVHRTDNGKLTVVGRRHPRKIPLLAKIVREMFVSEIGADKPISWLDVGTGYGEFLEALSASLPAGSDVSGIEPMEPKVAKARSRGLAVDTKSLNDIHGQFDVVSIMNVFSHIPDFFTFGAELAEKIRPGGILFVETGNGGDLETRQQYPSQLYLPDHLVFAGVSQMREIVSKLGFLTEQTKGIQVDSYTYCVKNLVKGALNGKIVWHWPYTSPFRSMFYKCRKKV